MVNNYKCCSGKVFTFSLVMVHLLTNKAKIWDYPIALVTISFCITYIVLCLIK